MDITSMKSSLDYSSENKFMNEMFNEIDSLHTGITPIPDDKVEDNAPETQSVPVIENLVNQLQHP